MTNPVDHLPAREYGIVLSRDLGWLYASLIGVGVMLSAGVFVLMGAAAGLAGPALPLAWALAGLVTALTAAAYAELSSVFPEAGGSYLWARESLGGLPGFLAGWLGGLAHAVACGLYALGLGAYLAVFMVGPGWLGVAPGGLQKFFGVGVVLLLAYLNYRGAQRPRRASSLISLAMLVTLVLVMPAGLAALRHQPDWPVQFTPLLPNGISGLVAAMGLTFIAFTGYEMIAQASEEVRQPRRNIPRAIFLSIGIGAAVALIVAFVAVAALDDGGHPGWRQLAAAGETAVVGAARQWRPGGAWVVILAGLLGTGAALNAAMYTSARISFAMGRDKVLPGLFGAVHAKHRTPHRAILFSAALTTGVVVALPIEAIAALTSITFLLLFMLVNASLIALRRNRPDLHRGFRAPWVPGLPVVGIVLMGGLAAWLFTRGPLAWLPALVWIAGGVGVYYLYAQWHSAPRAPLVEARMELTRAFRVLLPVAKPERAAQLSPLAAALAGRKDGEVLATHVEVVPAQLPLRSGRHFVEQTRTVLQQAAQIIAAAGVPAHSMIRVAHDAASGIREAAHETGAEVIVMGWRPKSRSRDRLLGPTLDPLLADPPCNVMVLRAEALGTPRRILVPMAGGPNATLAMSYALRLAEHWDGQITAMTVVALEASEAERQAAGHMLDEALGRHAGHARLQTQVVAAQSPLEGILHQAAAHDLVMLGASREGVIDRALFGDIPEQVAAGCETPVIIVKRRVGPMTGWLRRALDRASARMPRLTPEERIEVYKTIRRAARPDTDYFVMIALAAGIAALGLLLNSPAVIIGAMLVAPLMAAIVGLGMGIMMGDLRLLKLAASATLRGMFLAMGVGLLAGWLAPSAAPTAEILSRTQPTLLDLGVALLSGAAGAYALCREDVSASLPGVAIAAALVPPLATAGIGLARGDVNIAGGATLLFVTNLIAISAASVIVFLLFGFRPAAEAERLNVLRRGMLGAAVLLAVVALTLSLLTFNLVKQVRFEQQVRAAVAAEVNQLGQVEVVAVQIDTLADGGVSLEVTIRSARGISYEQTVTLQKNVAGRLNRTVALRLTVIPTTQLDPFVPPTPTPTSTATPTPDLTATSTWTPSATPTATATEVPTSTATPSPAPSATPILTPTASPTPTLTATPTPTPLITGIVANTDGRGVRVRAAPGGQTVTAWREGTRVTLLAGPVRADGRDWLRLRDESGLAGWVAAEYVLISP